jgi:hypothetical protein
LASEVSEDHRHHELGWKLGSDGRTGEAVLDLADRGAPITTHRVAVVAGFVRPRKDHAVATDRLAVSAGAVRLVLAVGVTTIERCQVPIVTLFGSFAYTVAAGRRRARRARRFAFESIFELAAIRATIGHRVRVVALLEARDDPISAFCRTASHTGLQANPTRLELAIRAATVRGRVVVVVALLRGVDTRVTADERHASRAWARAAKALLDHHAITCTAVIASAIPVVAGLGWLSLTVSAVSIGIDATASSIAAGARVASDATDTCNAAGATVPSSASDSTASVRAAVTTGS